MKKVAIITITHGCNYGNRLQNYAMQETISKLGCEVETIIKVDKKEDHLEIMLYKIKCLVRKVLNKSVRSGIEKRKKKFKTFNKNKIVFSKHKTYKNTYTKGLPEAYDYFVCGSDQIWNPYFEECYRDIESSTALFAENKKRIAYAASFGIEILPDNLMDNYSRVLKDMKQIFVREDAGVKIIKDLLDKEVSVVLDPTLLLDISEWKKFAKKPKGEIPDKYIVTYFIGGMGECTQKYIEEIAKQYNFDIVELNNEWLWDCQIKNINHFSSDPQEFVFWIMNSEMVFTDSYHASVFSVIFNKNFRVFSRIKNNDEKDMTSRIDTLLDIIGTKKPIGDLKEDVDKILINRDEYDYLRLNELKNKSIECLEVALEV